MNSVSSFPSFHEPMTKSDAISLSVRLQDVKIKRSDSKSLKLPNSQRLLHNVSKMSQRRQNLDSISAPENTPLKRIGAPLPSARN